MLVIREALINEEDLFFLMSRRLGISAIPEQRLLHLTLSPEIRRRVPGKLARDCLLVPLDLDVEMGCLSVAIFDPTDQTVLESLRQVSRVAKVQVYLARRSAILEAVDAVYSTEDESLEIMTEALENLPKREAKVEIDPSLAQEIATFEEMAEVKVEAELEMEHDVNSEVELESEVESEVEVEEKTERKMLTQQELAELTSMHPQAGERTEPFPLTPVEDALMTPMDQHVLAPVDADHLEYDESVGEEETMEHEITQVRAAPTLMPADDPEALLKELLSSVGILVSMLEERIDPTGGVHQEYGRLSRLTARQMGMDEVAVSRVALAAHLFGLDLALRRELGKTSSPDVTEVFGSQPTSIGGLGPSLRALGARALGYTEVGAEEPMGIRLIRLVSDFLELRAESHKGASDMETVVQLLRAGGRDSALVEGLIRAIETTKTPQVKLLGSRTKGDN